MFLNDALAVIGVFLLGAAAGACLKYARYRSLVALCNQLLTETRFLHAGDRTLQAGHSGQSPVVEGESASCLTRVELPVGSRAEFSNREIADFQLQPDDVGATPRALRSDSEALQMPVSAGSEVNSEKMLRQMLPQNWGAVSHEHCTKGG
jgi:hypothetical protein